MSASRKPRRPAVHRAVQRDGSDRVRVPPGQPDDLVRSLTLAALRSVVATGGIDQLYTEQLGEVEGPGAGNRPTASGRRRRGHRDDDGAPALCASARGGARRFRDVASAQEDKLRTINRARTFAVEKVQPRRGEAAAMVQEALAFRDEQILKARDEAAGFGRQADAYRAAPDLTTFRLQLEPIEEVLPGTARSFGRASARSSSSIYGAWSRSAGKRGDGGAQAASRGVAPTCAPTGSAGHWLFGAVTSRSSRATPHPGRPPWCGAGTPIRSASCTHGTRCLRSWAVRHPRRSPRPAPA
jgi:hypothetical protein